MSIPIVIEKVLRASLRCFQRGGIIPNGSDISKIEQIPNNASDADIDAVLDSISFASGGGGSAGDSLASTGDVNVFIDSDNDDSPNTGTYRYFRVAQDQATTPVTTDDNELFTVGTELTGITTNAPAATVGPRLSLATGDNEALLNVGTEFDLIGGNFHYGVLHGGHTAVPAGSVGSDATGLNVKCKSNLALSAFSSLRIFDYSGADLKGGWNDLSVSDTAFHVGDWTTPDSFAIAPVTVSGKNYFNLHTTSDSGAIPRIHLYNENATYRSQIIIGGPYGETWTDPNNYDNPTLLVSGDDTSTTAPVAYLLDRKTGRTVGSEVFTIRSDSLGGATNYYLTRWYVGATPVARIDDGGDMSITGSYSTGAGDLAEWVPTDQKYEPGTVLTVKGGEFAASSDYAQTSVAGVVSTEPGVQLGEFLIFDTTQKFPLDVYTSFNLFVDVKGDVVDRLGSHLLHNEKHFVKIESCEYRPYDGDVVKHEEGLTRIWTEECVGVGETDHLYGGVVLPPFVAQLGLCGRMPVKCSTEGGDIHGNGEILVSGPDGCAVVSQDPKPGTVIGKAVGKLISSDGSVVKGDVEVLVNLQ